jgi:hypothetical protein
VEKPDGLLSLYEISSELASMYLPDSIEYESVLRHRYWRQRGTGEDFDSWPLERQHEETEALMQADLERRTLKLCDKLVAAVRRGELVVRDADDWLPRELASHEAEPGAPSLRLAKVLVWEVDDWLESKGSFLRFLPDEKPESESVESSGEEELSRREAQVRYIAETVSALGFDPMAIPDGGKAKTRLKCKLEQPRLFTDAGFDEAWSVAVTQKRVRMAKHDLYAGRG